MKSNNVESAINFNFSLPFKAKTIFDFIILPKSMELYKGFFLIPGILLVKSSDPIRKEGTVDYIINNDGSTHSSVTKVLSSPHRYTLEIGEIKIIGLKKLLASIIIGFKEDWELQDDQNNHCLINRKLIIIHRRVWWARLLMASFIKPQLAYSLHLHHQRLKKALA